MSPRTLLFGLAAATVGGASVWFVAPPASAQFGGLGGGGFAAGPDAFKNLVPQSLAGEVVIQSGGRDPATPTLFIVISPDETRAWGYSTEKGEWKRLPLDGKAGQLTPILSGSAAFVADGRKVHAFGAIKGEWDTLELPEGSEPQPVVGGDYAEVRTKASVSVFSAKTGRWATVKFAGE